jgi:hypothetical protein
MATKVILTGKFSNYELHCEANGEIFLLNKKGDNQELQRLGAFSGSRGVIFSYRDKYKNLKKWIERKAKMVPGVSYSNTEQQNSNVVQSFYGLLKGEVRGYKLKEDFKEELK